eukprot:354731-Chlamydomonas_euryale.AAC.4
MRGVLRVYACNICLAELAREQLRHDTRTRTRTPFWCLNHGTSNRPPRYAGRHAADRAPYQGTSACVVHPPS